MSRYNTQGEPYTMSDTALLEALKDIVTATGSYQLKHFRTRPSHYGDRKEIHEMVSEIDLNSEYQLHEALTRLMPESSFFGEETLQQRSSLTWVVDPLDGTTNYLSGYDQWSISVALVCDDQPEAAMIYRPFTGEYFSALRGKGAWYNQNRLNAVRPGKLYNSLIATGFPYRSPDTVGAFYPCAQELLPLCRGIRRGGSAAIDLGLVAAGFLQGFWEADLQCYDTAAGILLAEETGCVLTDFFSAPYRLFSSSSLIAAPPGTQEELAEVIAKHYQSIDRIAGGANT